MHKKSQHSIPSIDIDVANPTTFYWERQAFVLHRDKNNKNQVILSPMCKGARPLGTKYFLRLYPCSIDQLHAEQHNGVLFYMQASPQATLLLTEVFHKSKFLARISGYLPSPCNLFPSRGDMNLVPCKSQSMHAGLCPPVKLGRPLVGSVL